MHLQHRVMVYKILLLIRFISQENPVDWFPTTTNTAGDLRLGAGSTFVQAVETKREIY